MRTIPCIAVDDAGESAFYRVAHRNAVYIGCPINAVRILSECNPDELAIINLQDYIPPAVFRFPRHSLRPISIVGGVKSTDDCRNLIRSGYDRVGLTIKCEADIYRLKQMCTFFGGSSMVAHIKISQETENFLIQLSSFDNLSEVVLHDVERAGRGQGIRESLVDNLKRQFGGKLNIAISGGYKGEETKTTVYYASRAVFADFPQNICGDRVLHNSILISHRP